jgi:hypothetical protein
VIVDASGVDVGLVVERVGGKNAEHSLGDAEPDRLAVVVPPAPRSEPLRNCGPVGRRAMRAADGGDNEFAADFAVVFTGISACLASRRASGCKCSSAAHYADQLPEAPDNRYYL